MRQYISGFALLFLIQLGCSSETDLGPSLNSSLQNTSPNETSLSGDLSTEFEGQPPSNDKVVGVVFPELVLIDPSALVIVSSTLEKVKEIDNTKGYWTSKIDKIQTLTRCLSLDLVPGSRIEGLKLDGTTSLSKVCEDSQPNKIDELKKTWEAPIAHAIKEDLYLILHLPTKADGKTVQNIFFYASRELRTRSPLQVYQSLKESQAKGEDYTECEDSVTPVSARISELLDDKDSLSSKDSELDVAMTSEGKDEKVSIKFKDESELNKNKSFSKSVVSSVSELTRFSIKFIDDDFADNVLLQVSGDRLPFLKADSSTMIKESKTYFYDHVVYEQPFSITDSSVGVDVSLDGAKLGAQFLHKRICSKVNSDQE